ncbi:hypothetical protein DEO72_LG6g2918 [Vigna unguiculata]|uniref:Uncharacterized protein n=1 Tax=Vigna unguiculata TaxID=3917 RepID=A0A4D6MBT0_VIGUN|nr:hypothetical protein DEO72_LG6g2918 [Vigna unguiculata]
MMEVMVVVATMMYMGVVATTIKVMEVGVLTMIKAMFKMMAMTMRMVMPRVVMIIENGDAKGGDDYSDRNQDKVVRE